MTCLSWCLYDVFTKESVWSECVDTSSLNSRRRVVCHGVYLPYTDITNEPSVRDFGLI